MKLRINLTKDHYHGPNINIIGDVDDDEMNEFIRRVKKLIDELL